MPGLRIRPLFRPLDRSHRPLPHQLEAVYHYFIKSPRIRFLLADDPGAGKTIMAGLLIQELKARGLIKRILIVAPANLTFQWQRELRDKFRQDFEVVRGAVLRATYGSNPWQEKDQVITSVSWVSRIEDDRDSLLRSSWDLVIVDEAHKMSAYRSGADGKDNKTLAYQLGEELSRRTDHYLLMTATPHKGDPQNFLQPVPAPAGRGRLRRRRQPGGGDAPAGGALLPAPRQRGPGQLPQP